MKWCCCLLLVAASALHAQGVSGSDPSFLLEGAYSQVGKTVTYDGAYRRIGYPGGDVPLDRGVCTDVLIRAYRHAGIDLQVIVHEDMVRDFHAYPRIWGAARPDSNIDHRRVPNLITYLARHGTTLAISARANDYAPGDIVSWRLASGVPHIGLVSHRRAGERYMVVHNIGEGTKIEDVLFEYEITGHFRYGRNAPDPSIERTPSSRLRLPTITAQVER